MGYPPTYYSTYLHLAGPGRRGALLPVATRAAGWHGPVQQGRQEVGVGQIPRPERNASARHVRESRLASRILLGPGALTGLPAYTRAPACTALGGGKVW